MDSTDWIDLTYYDSITVPQDASGPGPGESGGSSPSSISTASSNGTTPPSGAYIVSKRSIPDTKTYDSIQDALKALPSSDKTSTIFIYSGTYEEQITVDTTGTVILIGYSKSIDDFSANRVTIKHDAGADFGSSKSLSDGATVYAKGSGQLQAVNINFANTNTREKNAAVAFAVGPSTYASLYGCQVIGGQDALFVEGYIFTSNTYLEGSSDIILGSGAGYFLNSTLSPTEDDVSLTADKRAKDSSSGGLVFDQSSTAPAAGAGSLSNISLGRPWNAFARVAYIKSNLGSLIKAAGWDQWSPSSPRTGDVLIGEYGNSGPGSDTSDRAPFASQLDDSSVAQFEIGNFFESTSWIDFSRVAATPFTAGNGSHSTPTATSSGGAQITPATGLPATTTVTTTSIESVAADGAVKIIDSTTTVVVTSTATPKTTTSESTLTTTSVRTAEIKTSKITSTVTVFAGPEVTTTTQVQPTTVVSTKTDTKSVTTTLTCIPAKIASEHPPRSRDATSTAVHSPMVTGAAATPSPTIVTVQVTETSTTTLAGPILSTSYTTLTQTAKFVPPDVTVLSTTTKTVEAVLSLPAVTSTKVKTTTYTRTPSVPVTVQSTSTKTKEVTSTTTKTVTRTAKGARHCAT